MVIGGWFFTAFMAFTVALTFAFAIAYLGGAAIFLLLLIVGLLIYRNFKIHRRREKQPESLRCWISNA